MFHGGRILTLDPAAPVVEALAFRAGRVVARGSEADLLASRGPDTRVVDLGGRVLLPSLVDHHVHLLDVGLFLLNHEQSGRLFLDLTGLTLAAVPAVVARRCVAAPPGSWILGQGWSQGAGPLPSSEVLTRACPQHPVYLARVDGHAGWANARALEEAGIGPNTPDPAGGEILRGPDGEPTGVLLERANDAVLKRVPPFADQDLIQAFRRGARALAAHGITRIDDAGFLPPPGLVGLDLDLERYLDLLRRADGEEPLPIRVDLMVPAPSRLAEEVVAGPADYSPRLRVTHIKLFADGALGSRGAALAEPYADAPLTRGVFRMTRGELLGWVRRALDADLDVATHAIGDAAVGRVLDVYEQVLKERPGLSPRRLRIEHFSFASEADMRRAARLGVLIVIQPGFVLPDAEGRTMEEARVGTEASGRVYAFGHLLRLGAALAGSSDDFAGLSAPYWPVYAAVTRQSLSGDPPGGWHPENRLTREEALRLFTRFHPPGGGPAIGGRLAVGDPANAIVVSADPLAVPAADLPKIRVLATFREGRQVGEARDRMAQRGRAPRLL